MLTPWRKIKSAIKFKNPWWEYRFDNCILPSGKKGEYHYVHTNGSVTIIPFLNDGRILMINQFRYLKGKETLEFPCGIIKADEGIEKAAHRELIEEICLDGTLEKIGTFRPYKGIADETNHVFIAKNLKPSQGAIKDDCEEFELIKLTREEIDQKITHKEIDDGMTLAAWALVQKHL